ncbi:kinase/pyrophosphorylase [Alcanivorax sp. JB21]|uniref:posphoenolpyruvate synthetase regulatory kinase/phosphorylase PpsR n=1 Tax=Alcanivorax limicola TaxID=2874102 RepID=UPI001CBAD147|nr:pyruvate, water dikinase regulatory protein [Alcanivorax limicola]MBZ2187927.1 kinase/pyrophosphorylase [Alcanivorax limicola]
MKRTAFFVSDGTGITAETLGHSMLSQFRGVEFAQITLPYVQSEETTRQAVTRINQTAEADGHKPIVFSTVVNEEHREIIGTCNGLVLDMFAAFVGPLEDELGVRSSLIVGESHAIRDHEAYRIRIDAVHYALDNDDGARTRHYDKADIILVGVSRSGKTPTCLYLALQFGLYAGNYPLTEDDFDDLRLPEALLPHKDKLFGLTIDPDRLAAIRSERKSGSKYASPRQCDMEVRALEALFNKFNIPSINATELSIEEISTRILAKAGLQRRLQ